MSITDFLNARIAEDENEARALLDDLEAECERNWKGVVDERGPMTPQRLLKSQMWAHFAGQTRERNFAKGQHIATLANPARVLAECAAKRAIVELHQPMKDDGWVSGESHGYLWCSSCGSVDYDSPVPYPCDTTRTLAAVYSDHPDYQDSWKVEA